MTIRNVQLIMGGELPGDESGRVQLRSAHELELLERRYRKNLRKVINRGLPRRNEGPIALGRLGMVMEDVVRHLFRDHGMRLDPQRTLRYEERNSAGTYEVHQQELDGVVVRQNGTPKFLIEVRCSVQGRHAAHDKASFMKRQLAVARTRWPRLRGLVVFIRVGNLVPPNERLPKSNPPWLVDRHRFRPEALETAFQRVEVPILVLPFNSLWRYAAEIGWNMDQSYQRAANAYAWERYQRRLRRYEERAVRWDDIDVHAAIADQQQFA